MSQWNLDTTEDNVRGLAGKYDNAKVPASEIAAVMERALQPALAALRQEVVKMGSRTGRLRASPGVVIKQLGAGSNVTVMGLVGYRHGVAPHAGLVERGSPPRAGPRGKMPAFNLAWRAFFRNRTVIEETMKSAMAAMAQRSVKKLT